MKIRKNDQVVVLTGDDGGRRGRVHQSYPREGRVLVEGINMVKRAMKRRGNVRQAGIVEREAPVHMSNVMLVCPKCSKPTRVRFRFLEDGSKVRVCKKCLEVID